MEGNIVMKRQQKTPRKCVACTGIRGFFLDEAKKKNPKWRCPNCPYFHK